MASGYQSDYSGTDTLPSTDVSTFSMSKTTLQKRRTGRRAPLPAGRTKKRDKAQVNALAKTLGNDPAKRSSKST